MRIGEHLGSVMSALEPDAPTSEGPAPWAGALGLGIFVVVLGLSIWAIAWSFTKRRREAAAGHARPAPHGRPDRPETYDDHHRVRWEGDPATLRPEPHHWSLGVAAIFGICAGEPWTQLRHSDATEVRRQIAEAWGIRSRPQHLAQIHWLLTEGHRVAFTSELEVWPDLPAPAVAELERQLRAAAPDDETAAETLWRLHRVLADDRSIRGVRFEAWDLARVAMLCRAGVTVGHLSEAEALDTMAVVLQELRAVNGSWESMSNDFVRARWYWSSQSGTAAAETDAHDASRHAALLAPVTGPWHHLPWDTRLPEPQWLLVDALLQEGLVAPLPAEAVLTATGARVDQLVRERSGGAPSPAA